MTPIGGWQVFEKQSGGKGYDKYDTIYVVIVGKSKKPHILYFSKKGYEDMGRPEYIQIMFDGTVVGFVKTTESDPNGYKVQFTEGVNGRPFISSRSCVESVKSGKRKLKSGVYMAQLHNNGGNKIIAINSNDEPSYL